MRLIMAANAVRQLRSPRSTDLARSRVVRSCTYCRRTDRRGCGAWFASGGGRRMFALLGAGGFWAAAVGADINEKPGLVATQTFTFLFTDIEGSTAVAGGSGMRGRGFRLIIAGWAAGRFAAA